MIDSERKGAEGKEELSPDATHLTSVNLCITSIRPASN